MLFAFMLALFLLLLFVRLVTLFISFGLVMMVIVDMLVIGGFAVFYGHHNWFVYIASGKAVYFWDIVLFMIVVFLYSGIVFLATSKFPRIAAIFHYAISWVVVGIFYLFIHYASFNGLGLLLNNEQLNVAVHIIIISILALFVFRARMRMFKRDM